MDQFHTIEKYWTDRRWIGNRMLFVSGPRQVGKTSLIRGTICTRADAYFNWDDPQVRSRYRENSDFFMQSNPSRSEWVCFDEIHKRPKWKDILKGVYDTHKDDCRFVITGSARLEVFRRSGDSLVGRYFHTHLFPLNLADFRKKDFVFPRTAKALLESAADEPISAEFEPLLSLGGFPEPFFSGSEMFWKRWSVNHQELLIREDLRDLSRVVEFDKIAALAKMLKPSIGNTVSNLSLAEDLEASHASVKRWLQELSKVHLVFPVAPYSKKVRRAFRQEKKWYYTDWRAAGESVFENYVACTLERAITLYFDRFGEEMGLHFIRTHDGTEVDFLITREGKPWLLVEAKQGQAEVTRGVHRFTQELGIPCAVVTRRPGVFRKKAPGIYVVSMEKLAQALP